MLFLDPRAFLLSAALLAVFAGCTGVGEPVARAEAASSADPPTGTSTSTSDEKRGTAAPERGGGTLLAPGAVVASTSCGKPAQAAGFFAGRSIDVAGATRTYDLFVPPAAKTALVPIVFVFHADNGASLRPDLPLENASAGQAIFVYPYGRGNAWDLGAPATNGDYPFVEQLKAELHSLLCVDEKRTFAYGFSNGAFFVNMLACYRGPSLFRAIATSSGGLYPPEGAAGFYDDRGNFVCPMEPVASLVLHGTSDRVVSYEGDGLSARDSWRAANGCASSTRTFGPSPCVAFDGCSKNPVGFCNFPGGHELWSGTASAVWTFFAALQ